MNKCDDKARKKTKTRNIWEKGTWRELENVREKERKGKKKERGSVLRKKRIIKKMS